MNELNKLKLPFALALLAAMLTITPIINKYGSLHYPLFGNETSVNFIYLVFCGLLGASVYFYAIALVGEHRFFGIMNSVGHVAYALALVVPPLFLALYPVSLLTSWLVQVAKNSAYQVFGNILSGVLGSAASALSLYIWRNFSDRDKEVKAERSAAEETRLLTRARQLFQQDYYDLAIADAWRAVEMALYRTLEAVGERQHLRSAKMLFEVAQNRGLLTSSQIGELEVIRQLRNEVVHTERRLTQEDALKVLDRSEKAIATLEKAGDRCYFCNSRYPFGVLETDDITGASACPNCRKKYPDWKDELMDLGMDP